MRFVICLFSLFILFEFGETSFGVESSGLTDTQVPSSEGPAAKAQASLASAASPGLTARTANVASAAPLSPTSQTILQPVPPTAGAAPFPLTTRMESPRSHNMTSFLKPVPSVATSYNQLASNPLAARQYRFENLKFGYTQTMLGQLQPSEPFLYGIDSAPPATVPMTEPKVWNDALPDASATRSSAEW